MTDDAILVSKGILPERAMPEERETMKIPGYDLDGWKEIAAWLRAQVRAS